MSIDNIKRDFTDRLKIKESVVKCLDNPDGQRIIRYLMKVSGILHPRLTTDTNLLLIRQGQQSVVFTLLRILNKDISEIIKQIEESIKE